MYRDIGHARISKDDQLIGMGTGRQEKDVRRVSAESGGEIIEMLIEDDTPASRFSKKQRQKYEHAIALLRSGAADRIVSYRLDRLLRIPRMLEDLIDLCEERPFLVVNIHGSIDLNTAEGRKYARDRVADAAYETDIMSERWRRLFDETVAEGRPHGARGFGYACLGLRTCEGDECCHGRNCGHRPRHKRCCPIPGCPHDGITVIEPEAEAIRRAARDVLAGESLTKIARRWNAQGFLTAQEQNPWDGTNVKRVLTGLRQAGRRHHRGEDAGPAVWSAIIDTATRDALVAKFGLDPNRPKPPRTPPRRQPFTGLFRTTEGVSLVRGTDHGRAVYRVIGNQPGRRGTQHTTVAAEPLEAMILEMLFYEVESGRVGEKIAVRRKAQVRSVGEDPAVVQAELVQLAEDKANPEMGLTRAEWLAQRNALMRRLEAAEAAQVAFTADAALVDVDPDLRARWNKAEHEGGYSVDRKRAILAAVFERVEILPALRRGPGFDPNRVRPVPRE